MVKVIDINGEDKKISLSLKQAASDYEEPKEAEESKKSEKPEEDEIVKEELDTTIGDMINIDIDKDKE